MWKHWKHFKQMLGRSWKLNMKTGVIWNPWDYGVRAFTTASTSTFDKPAKAVADRRPWLSSHKLEISCESCDAVRLCKAPTDYPSLGRSCCLSLDKMMTRVRCPLMLKLQAWDEVLSALLLGVDKSEWEPSGAVCISLPKALQYSTLQSLS